MTFYNTFQNFNIDFYTSPYYGLNSFMPPCDIFGEFTTSALSLKMPTIFDFKALPKIDFSQFFPNNILNMPTSINFNQNFLTPSPVFNFSNSSVGDNFVKQETTQPSSPAIRHGSGQTELVNKALSYVGKVNSDQEGNRLFSYGRHNQWCADFASYNVYETFGRSKMKSLGFPDTKAGGIASRLIWRWGKNQNRQIMLRGKSNKKEIIANQVKPGDIMILCRGTYSEESDKSWPGHTAIVTEVHPDGSFKTVDGNSKNDSVRVNNHRNVPDNIVGFVRMDNLA